VSYEYLKQLDSQYFELLDYMIEIKAIKNVVILTNDREHCSNIFNYNPKYSNINFIYTNEVAYIDMWIISMIKNNILSFSSLAWWGSYLNECEDKFIIGQNVF
jgi:hypothetical protein